MKKKILIIVGVVATLAIVFGFGSLIGLFPWQYLSEDKVEAFIEDSHYAFVYSLPDPAERDEDDSLLNSDLEERIAASVYAANRDFALDSKDDAYVISKEELNKEKDLLFFEVKDGETGERELLKEDGDNYLLQLKDVKSDLTYEIVEASYGLIGSESTYITVAYKLKGQEYRIEYALADDKDSPYKFKVSDIRLIYDYSNLDITGLWMAEHPDTDDYYVLTFNSDGSGALTHMGDWLGVPFTYETDQNYIDTHMGSADDYTPMTYDGFEDAINYNDVKYTRVDDKISELFGKYASETDADGEFLEMIIEPDGTGYVMNRPLNTGVPIRYHISADGSVMADFGSPEFSYPLTYDKEKDVITYEDVNYTREK